ncbi:MAG TPA: choice-of-anchor tandem repeat GloVer-containing protein [Bryobacteraceae bacterium]|nr:choice-of-anchor tandem repeat GloVer-containing protein [Bryobacteraceae bacterium]
MPGGHSSARASLLAPCAAAQAHFATVYEFSGGAAPAGLTAANGVLYGTAGSPDCGTVFELQPPGPGGGQWTQTVLYTFTGENGDACGPNGLTAGPNGILYGASIGGGFTHDGTVFELLPPTSPSASWTETVLHSFTGGAGGTPFGNAIIGGQGEIYGASSDGTYGCGNVFELRPPAAPGGEWTETVLYSFQGGEDGSTPYSPVTTAGDGSIYGTTFGTMIIGAGSGPGPYGVGTVFELKPPVSPGGIWTKTVLQQFGDGNDCGPNSPLIPRREHLRHDLSGRRRLGVRDATASRDGRPLDYYRSPPVHQRSAA